MNCMNCGAALMDSDLEYCPSCGCNVMIQRKVDYLSKYYYNQGLEKASIRDLSGAITCLKQSLTYNKANIRARNLLGLVYFEMGEVVAALSEWVISQNIQPNRNLASEYITKLRANQNKLEAINETIRKYNHALELCREGHDDMAAIQLKKILSQNSKLIKGYHLLALIQIKERDWSRARKTLRKAARIDKTNTTTLRFLKEIDEQTGVTTKLEKSARGLFRPAEETSADGIVGEGMVVHTPAYKERSGISLFFTLMLGFAAGAAGFWLLVMPAIRQGIYREANEQIVRYSESLASQSAELSKVQGEARQSTDIAQMQTQNLELEKRKSNSFQALLTAYMHLQQNELDSAAVEVQKVYEEDIPDGLRPVYNNICNETGVTGISAEQAGTESGDGTSDGSADSGGSGYDNGGSGDGGYNDGGSGDGGYDDGSSGDGGYDDGSSGDGGYDDGGGDGGYDDGSGDGGYDDSGDSGDYVEDWGNEDVMYYE